MWLHLRLHLLLRHHHLLLGHAGLHHLLLGHTRLHHTGLLHHLLLLWHLLLHAWLIAEDSHAGFLATLVVVLPILVVASSAFAAMVAAAVALGEGAAGVRRPTSTATAIAPSRVTAPHTGADTAERYQDQSNDTGPLALRFGIVSRNVLRRTDTLEVRWSAGAPARWRVVVTVVVSAVGGAVVVAVAAYDDDAVAATIAVVAVIAIRTTAAIG